MKLAPRRIILALAVLAGIGLLGFAALSAANRMVARQPAELVSQWAPADSGDTSALELRSDGTVGAFPSSDLDPASFKWSATNIHRRNGEFTATLTLFHDSGWWDYSVTIHDSDSDREKWMELDLGDAYTETGQQLAPGTATRWESD